MTQRDYRLPLCAYDLPRKDGTLCRRLRFVCLLISVFFLTSSKSITYKHDFHLSTTEVTQNPTAQKTEWLIRVFQDDLEFALKNYSAAKIDLQRQPETNIRLKEYLTKHFSIKKDGRIIPTTYLGYELQEQSCWVYIETDYIKLPLRVKATWLQELYEDQRNIFRFQFSENRSFYTATKSSPEIDVLK